MGLPRKQHDSATGHRVKLLWPPLEVWNHTKRSPEASRIDLVQFLGHTSSTAGSADVTLPEPNAVACCQILDERIVLDPLLYPDYSRESQRALVEHFQASCNEQGFMISVKEWAQDKQDRVTPRLRLKCKKSKCKFSFQINWDELEQHWYLARKSGGNFVHSCGYQHPPATTSAAATTKTTTANKSKRDTRTQPQPQPAFSSNFLSSTTRNAQQQKTKNVSLTTLFESQPKQRTDSEHDETISDITDMNHDDDVKPRSALGLGFFSVGLKRSISQSNVLVDGRAQRQQLSNAAKASSTPNVTKSSATATSSRPVGKVAPNQGGPIPKPHPHDVLSGRGAAIQNHQGNVRFRSIVQQNRSAYAHAHQQEKKHVAARVVHAVRHQEPPGRFLRFSDGKWHEIGDDKALQKARQAFRESIPPTDSVVVKRPADGDQNAKAGSQLATENTAMDVDGQETPAAAVAKSSNSSQVSWGLGWFQVVNTVQSVASSPDHSLRTNEEMSHAPFSAASLFSWGSSAGRPPAGAVATATAVSDREMESISAGTSMQWSTISSVSATIAALSLEKAG